jgi:hypothetical protein
MQNVIAQQHDEAQPHLTLSVEVIAYLLLLLLTLALRLAELDTVPLSLTEAQQALAAWQTLNPIEAVEAPVADSPLLFGLQKLAFSVLGGHEFAARLGTALAGAALVFTPLLFRDRLGNGRAFAACALLAASPVLLVTARTSSAVTWAALGVVLMLWAVSRLWQTRERTYGIFAVVLLLLTLFITDHSAPWAALMLLLAAIGTLALFRPQDDEIFPGMTASLIRERLASIPWFQGMGIAALLIILISTALLTYPTGLSSVGQLLGESVRALTTGVPGQPALYVLNISTFYEPFLWLFGLVAVILIFSRDVDLLDRFLVVWLLLMLVAAILFRGWQPAHALWLTLPLTGLTSRVFVAIFEERQPILWDVPGWVRPLLALIAGSLLAVFAIGIQLVGRSMLRIQSLEDPAFVTNVDAVGSILVLMVILFFIVGYFLAASLWNARAAASGIALGTLIFGMITSLGSGWNAAVTRASDPSEFWHVNTATTNDSHSLRDTLLEIAQRESRGIPSLPLVVEAPTDGIIAWVLRDFTNVRYITDVAEARGESIAILSSIPRELTPDLGGSYVGQDFIVRRAWQMSELRQLDRIIWWAQRESTLQPVALETVVLWLREDIYQGVDFLEATAAE